MYEKPNEGAVVRSLSAILRKAERIAGERRVGVGGDMRNSRTLLLIEKRLDETHTELLKEAMDILASYVDQVDASPKEMTTWARAELEGMATQVLGQMTSPIFPNQASEHRKRLKEVFDERLGHALREFEFGRVNGRSIQATPAAPGRSDARQEVRPDYVSETRITALRAAKSSNFDTSKLVRLCEELNSNWQAENYYSVAMLVRAIIDHVPPVFGVGNFSLIAAGHGTKSFKEHETPRRVAEDRRCLPSRTHEARGTAANRHSGVSVGTAWLQATGPGRL